MDNNRISSAIAVTVACAALTWMYFYSKQKTRNTRRDSVTKERLQASECSSLRIKVVVCMFRWLEVHGPGGRLVYILYIRNLAVALSQYTSTMGSLTYIAQN